MNKMKFGAGLAALFWLGAVPGGAQTQIDLATQSKHVDFSGASSTKPATVGTVVPASCSVGQFFFNSSAPAGENLYLCTALNTWSQVSGGSGGGGTGGAGMVEQLGDFAVTGSGGASQTIGAQCASATPCQARIGPTTFTMTAPATVTISGTSAAGTVFWYISSSLLLTVGHNTAATLTCSTGCVVATGVTAFPPDSIPLWATTFTANVWNTVTAATMDKRAVFSRDIIAAGSGISSVSNPVTGIQTLSTDPTIVPRYFAGSGAPSMACAAARDFYTDETNQNFYFCAATNTWKQANPAGSGGSATQTIYWNFPVTGDVGGTGPTTGQFITSGGFQPATALTGPGSVGSVSYFGTFIAAGGYIAQLGKASHTWSAAAGTIDIEAIFTLFQGAVASGTSWNFNFYVACANPSNGTFSFGSATSVNVTPPTANGNQVVARATGLNMPSSCAADSPLQLWIVRTADSGGSTGSAPLFTTITGVIRGN